MVILLIIRLKVGVEVVGHQYGKRKRRLKLAVKRCQDFS
jgi:hypothetical protein